MPFASIYYAAVNANPVDPSGSLVGLFPVRLDDAAPRAPGVHRGCYLGLAVTCDGVHFGHIEPLVDLGCAFFGRTYDFPVDGLAVDGGDVVFVVHRDMPTEDALLKAHADRLAPRLVRHALPLRTLHALTNASKARLPTCARTAAPFDPLPEDAPKDARYPLCTDPNLDGRLPFSKLNTPAKFAADVAKERATRQQGQRGLMTRSS